MRSYRGPLLLPDPFLLPTNYHCGMHFPSHRIKTEHRKEPSVQYIVNHVRWHRDDPNTLLSVGLGTPYGALRLFLCPALATSNRSHLFLS